MQANAHTRHTDRPATNTNIFGIQTPCDIISCHNCFWIAFFGYLRTWLWDVKVTRHRVPPLPPSSMLKYNAFATLCEQNFEIQHWNRGRGCFTRSWFKIPNFYIILTSNIKSCDNNYVVECLKMSFFQENVKWILIPIVSKTLITMTVNRKILLAVAGLPQLFDVRCKSLQCSVSNIMICG
jgi:hypothetical protein